MDGEHVPATPLGSSPVIRDVVRDRTPAIARLWDYGWRLGSTATGEQQAERKARRLKSKASAQLSSRARIVHRIAVQVNRTPLVY